MKLGLFIVAMVIVLGGLLGTLASRDPGYVLIAYNNIAMETSLWAALACLLVLYFVMRLIVYLFTRFLRSRGGLARWNENRRLSGARQQTVQGMLLMAEGEWADAKRLLAESAPRTQTPLVNYLNAARAAHELNESDVRDDYLSKALESTPGSKFAVGLTQAELQKSSAQWEQCLATLLQLKSDSPKHPLVLKMLGECYRQVGDWDSYLELLPSLKKAKLITAEQLKAAQSEAWQARMQSEDAVALWDSVPKELRRDSALAVQYANKLIELGENDFAESVVRRALDQQWQPELIDIYGTIVSSDVRKQLAVAEGWVKNRSSDGDLLLALGRICMMNESWEKAREYLEASLRQGHRSEVYGELGRLCSAMGDTERGTEYLNKGLANLPDLPLPAS